MDGSKLSLIMVFMISAVAARLIPNGDVDKEHNSDDQERLDHQDIYKPAILATGICARSPRLPCCERTIEFYKILSQPVAPADIFYPDCRSDGYYAAKQCDWIGCYCVDPNGKRVEGTTQPGDFENRNIICPEIPKPDILATGICARSPNLPCCKEMIKVYELLKGPALIADLSYPHCRYYGFYAGYYAAKQCTWAGCHCVDPNGKSVKETYYFNKYYMICPEFAVEKPNLGSYEYDVEPADKLLTSEEISNLPDQPAKEDPETAGKTIDELIGGRDIVLPTDASNAVNHKRLASPIAAETQNTMEHANGDGKQGSDMLANKAKV